MSNPPMSSDIYKKDDKFTTPNDIYSRPSDGSGMVGGELSRGSDAFKFNYRDSRFSDASQGNPNTVEKKKYEFKVILLGDICVGKTAILTRLVENEFEPKYKCTLGVTNKAKSLIIDENTIATLRLWDTAGDEKFRAMTRQYFKGSDGIFLVFDLTQESSFDSLESWLEDVKESAPKNVTVFLVANKSDLAEERKVSQEQIENFANNTNLFYVEVSAKKGNNTTLLFEKMAKELVNKAKTAKPEEEKENVHNNSILIHEAKSATQKAKINEQNKSKCC
ncbi:MAG: GTP-binding protein [archaeon]|nr:GTP-binding protein [archaeon]